ncbi:MAG: tetratricopeptide repeat protein [Planctomycetes bacterium]|nr:tetratricopeptide repeat protein [Planctomycetota bacterium]
MNRKKTTIVYGLLLGACALSGCRAVRDPNSVGSDRLDQAARAVVRGDHGVAIELLKGRVDGSIRGSKLLGKAWLATGDPEKARAAFARAAELDHQDAETWMLLGEASERDRFFERSIDAYENVLKLQPQNAAAAKRHAFLLTDLHLYGEAVASLHRAAKLAPDDEDVLYKLGAVELARDHDEEAIAAFDLVLARKPAHPSALNGRGVARARAAKLQQNQNKRSEWTDSAVHDLEESLKLSADDPEPAYNLGWVREEIKNDPVGAETAYREALRRRKQYLQALIRLAGILASRNAAAEAADYYKQALDLAVDPDLKSELKKKADELGSANGGLNK